MTTKPPEQTTAEQLAERLERRESPSIAEQQLAAAELRRQSAAIAALEAENERLRADAERLEWINNHATVSHQQRATPAGIEYPTTFTIKTIVGANDLNMRAAIDAAMKEQTQSQNTELKDRHEKN